MVVELVHQSDVEFAVIPVWRFSMVDEQQALVEVEVLPCFFSDLSVQLIEEKEKLVNHS